MANFIIVDLLLFQLAIIYLIYFYFLVLFCQLFVFTMFFTGHTSLILYILRIFIRKHIFSYKILYFQYCSFDQFLKSFFINTLVSNLTEKSRKEFDGRLHELNEIITHLQEDLKESKQTKGRESEKRRKTSRESQSDKREEYFENLTAEVIATLLV